MAAQQYLVTGGAGFIGSHLVEALVTEGKAVRVLDDLSTGRLANLGLVWKEIDFIQGDIRDPSVAKQVVQGVDTIFHLAGLVSVPRSIQMPLEAESVNTLGTLTLLEAAQAAGVTRLVFSSTCALYGDDPTLPKTEASPLRPKSPYAISKLAAEMYCGHFNDRGTIETVILRYFNVFGPRQDASSPYSGVISLFVKQLSAGLTPIIFGDGEQSRDFVFVIDVVRANLLAAQSPSVSGKSFNIGTGRPVTINHLLETLNGLLRREVRPEYRAERVGDIRHSYADTHLAEAQLGWVAQVGFEEALAILVADLPPSLQGTGQ